MWPLTSVVTCGSAAIELLYLSQKWLPSCAIACRLRDCDMCDAWNECHARNAPTCLIQSIYFAQMQKRDVQFTKFQSQVRTNTTSNISSVDSQTRSSSFGTQSTIFCCWMVRWNDLYPHENWLELFGFTDFAFDWILTFGPIKPVWAVSTHNPTAPHLLPAVSSFIINSHFAVSPLKWKTLKWKNFLPSQRGTLEIETEKHIENGKHLTRYTIAFEHRSQTIYTFHFWIFGIRL